MPLEGRWVKREFHAGSQSTTSLRREQRLVIFIGPNVVRPPASIGIRNSFFTHHCQASPHMSSSSTVSLPARTLKHDFSISGYQHIDDLDFEINYGYIEPDWTRFSHLFALTQSNSAETRSQPLLDLKKNWSKRNMWLRCTIKPYVKANDADAFEVKEFNDKVHQLVVDISRMHGGVEQVKAQPSSIRMACRLEKSDGRTTRKLQGMAILIGYVTRYWPTRTYESTIGIFHLTWDLGHCSKLDVLVTQEAWP